MIRSPWFALPRKIVSTPVRFFLLKKEAMVVSYKGRGSEPMRLIQKIKKETDVFMAEYEAYHIYMVVKKTAKVPGDIAEVGVYRGGSAKVICEAREKGNEKLVHLFDTFEGLPEVSSMDKPGQFQKGEFAASLEEVKKYLASYPRVNFYKGWFPDTATPIEGKQFSFVHMDVDIYESTRSSIEFFYPRMSKGGVIISHDYGNAPGVRKAFDDFFQDKPEPVFEFFAGNQCMVVKS